MVAQDAGWDQVQHRFLAADHQRMTGIVPALKAHHAMGVVGQPIDDFALAFITPLSADYYYVFCHYRFLKSKPCCPRNTRNSRKFSAGCSCFSWTKILKTRPPPILNRVTQARGHTAILRAMPHRQADQPLPI